MSACVSLTKLNKNLERDSVSCYFDAIEYFLRGEVDQIGRPVVWVVEVVLWQQVLVYFLGACAIALGLFQVFFVG